MHTEVVSQILAYLELSFPGATASMFVLHTVWDGANPITKQLILIRTTCPVHFAVYVQWEQEDLS